MSTRMNAAARPLAGIRVLDLTTVMVGPFATMMLADYGADVIKVESPGGDSTRMTGPAVEKGMASTFLCKNRNRRSVVLDLKQPAACEVLLKLAETADVLVYNMRPQKMVALGLGDDVLRARNQRLIVAGAHGYGSDGPYAGRSAYDDIIQGMCGLAALVEMQTGEPRYLPTVAADKTTGLYLAQAILMALVARARTGEGCVVEVPMFESMVQFTLAEHFCGAHFTPPLGEPGYSRALSQWRRPYKTTDGFVCLMPYTDAHWRRFWEAAGRLAMLDDPCFQGMAARTRNIDALYGELAKCVATQSTAYWLDAGARLDIPVAPMRRLSDLQDDPHLKQTGFFTRLHDPLMGDLVMPGAPLRFDGAKAGLSLPPRLGQHTVEVLQEAGLGAQAIDALLAARAAVQPDVPEVLKRGARGDPGSTEFAPAG